MQQDPLRIENELPPHLNQIAHTVIGAAIEVHRQLGPGFLESIYQEALVIELGLRGLGVQRQHSYAISYKQRPIATVRLDLLVESELVVELKAVDAVLPIHRAQLRSYLKAGGFQLGLLINFNVEALRKGIHRMIMSDPPGA